MLRWEVTLALKAVRGAANGGAIVWPLRARSTVLTTVDAVPVSALASRSGLEANLTAPVNAISMWLAPPTPSIGSGAGASASVLHSWDIRLAPVTPSTQA